MISTIIKKVAETLSKTKHVDSISDFSDELKEFFLDKFSYYLNSFILSKPKFDKYEAEVNIKDLQHVYNSDKKEYEIFSVKGDMTVSASFNFADFRYDMKNEMSDELKEEFDQYFFYWSKIIKELNDKKLVKLVNKTYDIDVVTDYEFSKELNEPKIKGLELTGIKAKPVGFICEDVKIYVFFKSDNLKVK